MNRIIVGLFLLLVSLAAAAEGPARAAGDPTAAQEALPAVEQLGAGEVLDALLAGWPPGSCATRASLPAGVPLVLARPLEGAIAASGDLGDLVEICCSCDGRRCCPAKGTCVRCSGIGGLPCICCNP